MVGVARRVLAGASYGEVSLWIGREKRCWLSCFSLRNPRSLYMHASIACIRTLPWSGEDVSFLIKLPAEWVLLRHCVRRPYIKLLDLVVLVRAREPSFSSLTFRLTFEEIQVFEILLLLLLLLLVSLFHCFFLSWPFFIFLVENE